jgi:hypothetical protein
MKAFIIIIGLFFSADLFGQAMKQKAIESYVKEISSLRTNNRLEKTFYPNMSACGGGLYGYYYNEKLVLIEATYQAEVGFSSRTMYLKDTTFIHINYREHFAEWQKYEQNYPSNKYKWDVNKMTYTDTLYTISLSNPIRFSKMAGDKVISKRINQELVDELLHCGQEMKKELAEVKTGR